MEFNQAFTAPSVPKLNRRNISSPLSSSAAKISSASPKPLLKKSNFSFTPKSTFDEKSIIKPSTTEDSEKTSRVSSVEQTLVETNKILVEIQKQLSLDFAMRIAEEKEKNASLKEQKSRRKFALKESSIESVNRIGNIVKSGADKVLAPVKSAFDKIIEFVSLIGMGIGANAIFNWLSDDGNKKKLMGWFSFIQDHYKWGLAALGAVAALKLVGPISMIVKIVSSAVGLLLKGLPLLKALLINPLFLKAMLAIGAGVLLFKGGQILFKEVRKIFTGSDGFSDAHDKLDQKLRDAGLDSKGQAPVVKSTRGRERQELSAEQIQVRDSVFKQREQLKELSASMKDELKTKRSEITGGRRSRSAVSDNSEALKQSRMEIIQKYEAKIPSIVGEEIEARAMGGPISSGRPYLVGEEGPELIVPKISGTVINNNKTEKIYNTISSKRPRRNNFVPMDLPPKMINTEKSIPTPAEPPIPKIPSTNIADMWRGKTPELYGIYV